MPIQTPHYPDLLFPQSALLRRWEERLMAHLEAGGFKELHPSLILREPLEDAFVQLFDGPDRVALRSDFTVSLARLLAQRFNEPPPRVCYAGAVFRKPTQPWEAVERFEVGCERIHAAEDPDADLEVARLLFSIPALLGLKGGILQLGHAALVRKPLAEEGLNEATATALVKALSRRAPHRIHEALAGHPAAPRLETHLRLLLAELDGEASLAPLAASPYAALLEGEIAELARTIAILRPLVPAGFDLRVDPAEVAGLAFYTGPTLRLWSPGAQAELAAGGRYDGLYAQLGKPWRAAGFCVRLSRLLDLALTRPDLFTDLPC